MRTTEGIDPFDAALFAFELRFEQELTAHWGELESQAASETSKTPWGSRKSSLLSRFFECAGDRLVEDIHLHFSKLLGVAMASRGQLGNQSPLDWTSSQVRNQVCNFLGIEKRFDPGSPVKEDSRVLNAALRISSNASLCGESTLPPRLPAWAGSNWSMRVAMGRSSKKQDLSWENVEPLSLEETQQWVRFREHEMYNRIDKQLQKDYCDALIEARAAGVSVLLAIGPETGSSRRNSKASRLGPKKRELSHYLDGAGLTARQRECISLRLEYGLAVAQIARRLGICRKTVDEHIVAAHKNLNQQQSKEKNDRNFAKIKPGQPHKP